ncbi:MAG: molybdopterin cofactor-binding domain-containing protein [Candidatus Limnocylindrales bacterium]
MPEPILLVVNGVEHRLPLDPGRSLLSVIRDELGLTGPKPGCGEGECGACTVLVDGAAVRSCVTTVGEVMGRTITTVEGLSPEGRLHPVAQAFLEEGALQCGYCTGGMIVSAAALLERQPHPDETAIREALNGNLCRCGAYPRIVRAVARAAEGTTGSLSAPVGPAAEPGGEPENEGAVERSVDDAPLPRPAVPWDLQPPHARDYFGILGDGLVEILPPEEARRHHPDQPGPWHANGGAWLHVGVDGRVTAFSGKVDFGQDNRTALSMLVAEELHVPLQAVRLVLGDTDLCPFDVGTFASRSITDAGDYLRAAAAAARGSLLEMAAQRLGVAVATLVADEGRVGVRRPGRETAAAGPVPQPDRSAGSADGAWLAYGELLAGVRRIEQATMDEPFTPGAETRLAGRPVPRLGARDAVTGRRRYVSDLVRPGMLYGRVLRAPGFGAALLSADVSAAAAMPGVTVVREGSFVGVAAPTLPGAARALAAIRAEWQPVPQPSDGEIVEYLRAHPATERGWEAGVDEAHGDVEGALADSAVRLEATYTAAYLAHVPLETRAALAEWEGDRLTVWTGSQRPFGVREQLATALEVPQERIRVIVPSTGGGWGGKHTGEAAIEAARLSRAAGRPVKVRWSREEETSWAYFRPFAVIDVRAGATAEGRLRAWSFVNLNSGPNALDTPYEVRDRRVDFQPAVSPLRTGSYRALAATANNFARESAMDELAHRLGVDPLEFRLQHLGDERLAATLRSAAERAGWGRPPHDGWALGIAGGLEKWARIATVAEVRVHDDGLLELLRIVSAYDCGQVVNPDGLVNQVEGATVMGLGGALFEAVRFADGQVRNARLSQYRVPRFLDVPPIEVILVDHRELPSAGGGETPIIAIAPAIANAIFAATGRRLRDLPLVPDGYVR